MRFKSVAYLMGAALLLAASSCSTSSITVQVLKPAEITVPKHIQSLAVENRSLSDPNNKALNIIEGIATGEGLFVDKEASENCITGFLGTISQSPRFEVKRANVTLYGTGTGMMMSPLQWEEVAKICKFSEVDALLVLEAFDSDASTKTDKKEQKVKNDDGTYTTTDYFESTYRVSVEAGWRLYDPSTKTVVDEIKGNDYKVFTGKGNDKSTSLSKLPSHREAVKTTGYFSGEQYGYRIAPMWLNVSRSYYKKGKDSDEMKMAASMVRVNDWESAATTWEKVLNHPNPKTAGRAAHNMAVASEVGGSLEEALGWAKKAAYDYGNKKSLSYIKILNKRLEEQAILDEQLSEE